METIVQQNEKYYIEIRRHFTQIKLLFFKFVSLKTASTVVVKISRYKV